MSGSSSNAKIKLLCLHGYMQSAEIFRSRVGSLRKALKSRVEFVFVDAPFEAQGLPDEDPDEVQGGRDGRSWWQWTDTGPAGRPSRAASYTGWEVAQESLLAALKEHEPDAVLGFSQGATATALLLAHLASSQAPQPCKLKCAIMVAGFLPRDSTVAQLVQQGGPLNTVPSLFITGTSDTLVPPDRTKQLFDCFNPSVVSTYTHSGAHFVPTCSGEFKSSLSAFLDAAAAGSPLPPLHRVASTAVVGNANGNASGGGGSGGMSASQSANSLVSADSSTPA